MPTSEKHRTEEVVVSRRGSGKRLFVWEPPSPSLPTRHRNASPPTLHTHAPLLQPRHILPAHDLAPAVGELSAVAELHQSGGLCFDLNCVLCALRALRACRLAQSWVEVPPGQLRLLAASWRRFLRGMRKSEEEREVRV